MSERCKFSNETYGYAQNRTRNLQNAQAVPSCCQLKNPPNPPRMTDPTITRAPGIKSSTCVCKSKEQLPPAYLQSQPVQRSKIPKIVVTPPMAYDQMDQRRVQQQRNIPQYPIGATFSRTRNVVDPPRNQTFAMSGPSNITRNVMQRTYATSQKRRDETYSRPLGFDRPLGFNEFTQPAPPYSQSNQTYIRSPTSTSTSSPYNYWSESEYSDKGPWMNFELPKQIKRVNIAPGASKTYPRMPVPLPSRNYSTYDDPQPIINIPEVAAYRKKAPRYYSTPTGPVFDNQGTSLSSVWGQDAGRSDSSIGWSKGVRMDSFNVYGEVTPEPANIEVPPRRQVTYMYPPRPQPNRIPAPHITHTYLQNPFPSIYNPFDILDNGKYKPRTKNRTRTVAGPPPAMPEADCPCPPNATFSVPKVVEKKSETKVEEKKEEAKGKDFCTVLEIRTPCAENPCVPGKPLQLAINVTCADPSMLVTPDKRFNVLKRNPKTSQPAVSKNKMDDVPSDCQCE